MKIPFLHDYVTDFNSCKVHKLRVNEPWGAWSKFFFCVGWWTTALLKLVTLPIQAVFLLVYAVGLGANFLSTGLARLVFIPRLRAKLKHVFDRT